MQLKRCELNSPARLLQQIRIRFFTRVTNNNASVIASS